MKQGDKITVTQFFSKWTDSYDREARLYPGLLVILPMVVLLACVFGPKHPVLISIVSIISFCGGPLLLARISRDFGKALEDQLYKAWGGKPSTQLLRHRDETIDKITKDRYHGALAKALNRPKPTVEDELRDAAAADDFYKAGTVWLISQTQDTKKHPMVFKEVKYYGFQRNMRGLKWIGTSIAALTMIAGLIHSKVLILQPFSVEIGVLPSLDVISVIPILVSLVMTLIWFMAITKASVKRSGFAYADRLLRSCDLIKISARRTVKHQENITAVTE